MLVLNRSAAPTYRNLCGEKNALFLLVQLACALHDGHSTPRTRALVSVCFDAICLVLDFTPARLKSLNRKICVQKGLIRHVYMPHTTEAIDKIN